MSEDKFLHVIETFTQFEKLYRELSQEVFTIGHSSTAQTFPEEELYKPQTMKTKFHDLINISVCSSQEIHHEKVTIDNSLRDYLKNHSTHGDEFKQEIEQKMSELEAQSQDARSNIDKLVELEKKGVALNEEKLSKLKDAADLRPGFHKEHYRNEIAPLEEEINATLDASMHFLTELVKNPTKTICFDLLPFEELLEHGEDVLNNARHYRNLADTDYDTRVRPAHKMIDLGFDPITFAPIQEEEKAGLKAQYKRIELADSVYIAADNYRNAIQDLAGSMANKSTSLAVKNDQMGDANYKSRVGNIVKTLFIAPIVAAYKAAAPTPETPTPENENPTE